MRVPGALDASKTLVLGAPVSCHSSDYHCFVHSCCPLIRHVRGALDATAAVGAGLLAGGASAAGASSSVADESTYLELIKAAIRQRQKQAKLALLLGPNVPPLPVVRTMEGVYKRAGTIASARQEVH